MTAAQVVARPWPLRIPPNPPESWFGYINRLASTYLCTPATLMASISPAGVRQHPHTGRALGMLATDDTLTQISHQFSLTAHEARGLFLMRYHRSCRSASRIVPEPTPPPPPGPLRSLRRGAAASEETRTATAAASARTRIRPAGT